MDKKIKLEEAIRRLENIIVQLENGDDDLEKIVNLYKEGSDLVNICKKKLDDFENKIEIITGKTDIKVDGEKV
jgi:exodeoxyribonuclease VII small subunit